MGMLKGDTMNKIPKKSQAIKDFKVMVAEYKWTYDKDPSMLETYRIDRKDFRKIIRDMEKGNWTKAYQAAYYMDTAPREHIPDSAWGLMSIMYEIQE